MKDEVMDIIERKTVVAKIHQDVSLSQNEEFGIKFGLNSG